MAARASFKESRVGAGAEHFEVCRTVSSDDCADVRFQFIQPRYAGFVSDISDSRSSLQSARGDVRRGDCEHWSAGGRSCVRELVGADRATEGHCDCGAALAAGDSVMGLLAEYSDACPGRVSDAVHGAGRVGCNPGAFERTVACGCARDVSGICVSAGQLTVIEELGLASAIGGAEISGKLSADVSVDGAHCREPGGVSYGEWAGTARGGPFERGVTSRICGVLRERVRFSGTEVHTGRDKKDRYCSGCARNSTQSYGTKESLSGAGSCDTF